MADRPKYVVDSWEQIDENEMFEQCQAVSETREAESVSRPHVHSPMVLAGEDALRSQYLPPEPSVKILKRPSREERLNAVEAVNGTCKPLKTLRQREAEYAEARQRIMGHAVAPEDQLYDRLSRPEPSPSAAPAMYTLLRPPLDRPPPDILRNPRGPDDSPGFATRR